MRGGISAVVAKTTAKREIGLSQKQIEGLRTLSGIIIAIVASAGIITLSAIAPNIFIALKSLKAIQGKNFTNKQKQRKLNQTFYYLKRSGLIRFRKDLDDFILELTALGLKRHKKITIDGITIPRPRKWKGKYWLVAADIPTKSHRRDADALRSKLKQLGFFSLQRTLWVYPYDPRKEMEFILNYYKLANFVTLMEISRLDVEDERNLRKFFKSRSVL